MKITGGYKTALDRQVSESIKIKNFDSSFLMNQRNEWRRHKKLHEILQVSKKNNNNIKKQHKKSNKKKKNKRNIYKKLHPLKKQVPLNKICKENR